MKKALFLVIAAALFASCGHRPDGAADQQAAAQDMEDDASVARMSAAADSVRMADENTTDATKEANTTKKR